MRLDSNSTLTNTRVSLIFPVHLVFLPEPAYSGLDLVTYFRAGNLEVSFFDVNLIRPEKKKKELCLVSGQISKSGAMAWVFFLFAIFWGFADILGQMEQHTAIHTKGLLD